MAETAPYTGRGLIDRDLPLGHLEMLWFHARPSGETGPEGTLAGSTMTMGRIGRCAAKRVADRAAEAATFVAFAGIRHLLKLPKKPIRTIVQGILH